jgi:hypothetical protein
MKLGMQPSWLSVRLGVYSANTVIFFQSSDEYHEYILQQQLLTALGRS